MARKVTLLTAGLAVLAAASLSNAQNTEGHSWVFSEEDWSSCTAPAELTDAKCEFSSRAAYCQVDADQTKAEPQTLCDEALKPADQVKACAEEKACKNAGVCLPESYTCECAPGYTGDLCEVAPPTYVWNATTWGDCANQVEDQTCGAQIATREVACVDEADITVAVKDENCVAEEKPAAESSEPCTEPVGTCSVNGSCNSTTFTCDCLNGWTGDLCAEESDYHWVPTAYGNCTAQLETQTCGPKIKSLSYVCVAKADAEQTPLEDESLCTTPKPADESTTEGCEVVASCVENQGACNSTTFTCDCVNAFAGDLCDEEADYLWTTVDGECEKQNTTQVCGALVKTISPICIAKGDETKTPVAETECNAAVKPAEVTTSVGCEAEEILCQNGGVCGAETLECTCVEGFEAELCQNATAFKWVYEDFGACEKQAEAQTCGPLLKSRAAYCAVNDETLAPAQDEANCTNPKPAQEFTNEGCEDLTVQCQNGGACNSLSFTCDCETGYSGDLCETPEYYYKTGNFSECLDLDATNTCNVTQVQIRDVFCYNTETEEKVEDSNCVEMDLAKPESQVDCDTVGKCEKNAASSVVVIAASAFALIASLAIAF